MNDLPSDQAPGAKKRSGYLPTLDGWRAVSILAVIFHHAPLLQWGPFSTSWLYEQGASGVQIFFAISGYLICTRLLEEEAKTGTLHLRGFYIRRVLRIQPAAFTYLVTVLLLKLLSIIVLSWRGWLGALFLIRNYVPADSLVASVDYATGHFWSLSVEEHFYLLLPGFLLLVKHRRAQILLGLSGLFLVWNHFCVVHHIGPQSYHRTDLCLPVLLLPSAIAILLQGQRFRAACERYLKPWVAFLIALAILAPLWLEWRHALSSAVLLVPAVLVLSTMLHPQSVTGRLLEAKPLRFIGRISYGLYLWQQLFVAGHFVPPTAAFGWFGRFPFSLLTTFALAIASYYWLELPCMRLGHRLAKPALDGRPELARQAT